MTGDEARTCAECGAAFFFRAGEQRFFATRGLPDAPRRCPRCRRRRKEVRRTAPVARPATSETPKPDAPDAPPPCALCGAPARLPRGVSGAHRPVACEACYRWRLGLGSGLAER